MDKKINFTLSIRAKLISAFMLTVIPIVMLGTISLKNTSQAFNDTVTKSAVKSLDISADYVNLLFENVENVSTQIMENAYVKAYSEGVASSSENSASASNKQLITEYLHNTVSTSNTISDIVIIPVKGSSLSTSGYTPSKISFDKVKNDAIIKKCMKLNGGIAWAGLHNEIDTAKASKENQYSITAARIMKKDKSGGPAAILVINIRFDSIEALLKNAHTSKTGTTHLISPDDKDISYMSAGTDGSDTSKLYVKSEFTASSFFRKVKNGAPLKGSGNIVFDSQTQFMAFSRVGTTNYLLISTIPLTELNSTTNSITVTTIVLTGFAILTSIILGLLISISMVKEIRQMLKTASAAALGDLTVNCMTSRRDELGALSSKLTEMVGNMRRLISQTAGIINIVEASAVKVSDSSVSISYSAKEISDAMQQISSCLTIQSQELEDSYNEIASLAVMISNVSDNAETMEIISSEAVDYIQSGLSSVKVLEMTSNEAVTSTQRVIIDINKLDEKSRFINKIVRAIAIIADQTKLLAFNAAIEAARAGVNGQGFSVIAQEVRKLSDAALVSTCEVTEIVTDIQGMISDIVSDTDSITQSMKNQDSALKNTIGSFNNIYSHMEVFSGMSSVIKDSLMEMNMKKDSAINNMKRISANSQEAAAASEEVTASVEEQSGWLKNLTLQINEMKQSAVDLSDSINKFRM